MWIRVETNIGGNLKVQRARTVLGLSTAEMVGLLVILWGEIAEHNPRGEVHDIPAATLEEWAGWRGEPGRFAEIFLQMFTTDGVIDSWEEFQGKLIERQIADRERKRQERVRGKSSDSPRTGRGKSRATVTVTKSPSETNETETTTTARARGENSVENSGAPSPRDITRLAVAANKGLAEHDDPGRRQPVPRVIATSGTSHTAAEKILTVAGVPIDFAESAIYTLAKSHNARGQVSSLNYFVAGTIELWEREQTAEATRNGTPPRAIAHRHSRRRTVAEDHYDRGRRAFGIEEEVTAE
jgi:hypothetical protein